MKKLIAMALTVLLVVLALPVCALAAEGSTGTENGFAWRELSDSTVALTGYTGPGGAVQIPDTLNGLPVSAIGDYAFNGNSYITSVGMPDTITSIGESSFSYCTNLLTLHLSDSLVFIGRATFTNCTSLGALVFPSSLRTIGNDAFHYCISVASIELNDGLESVGTSAFFMCNGLKHHILRRQRIFPVRQPSKHRGQAGDHGALTADVLQL